jgi:hypothetical protein
MKIFDSILYLDKDFLSPSPPRDLLLFGNGLRKFRLLCGRTTRQESAFVIQYLLGKL